MFQVTDSIDYNCYPVALSVWWHYLRTWANSHSRPAENGFNAFKAAISMAVIHTSHPTPHALAYVTFVMAQPWRHQILCVCVGGGCWFFFCHQILMGNLSMDFRDPASQMVVQVHMVPKEAK